MPATKRSLIQRVLKWGGATVAAVSLVAWGVGKQWTVGIEAPGIFLYVVDDDMVIFVYNGCPFDPKTMESRLLTLWHEDRGVQQRIERWPRDNQIRVIGRPLQASVTVPSLWSFLGGFLLFTWLTLREPRQSPPGHCLKCGYDLKGNVSGLCPECGTAVPKEITAGRS